MIEHIAVLLQIPYRSRSTVPVAYHKTVPTLAVITACHSLQFPWGRGGRVVKCRIAMLEVVSSNPGRGKINLQKVMGSDGKL